MSSFVLGVAGHCFDCSPLTQQSESQSAHDTERSGAAEPRGRDREGSGLCVCGLSLSTDQLRY